MAKKTHKQRMQSIVGRLSRKYRPDEILHELSVLYEEYSIAGATEAEVDFWLKCSRATGNLSSGTEKWLHEMIEEQEEEGKRGTHERRRSGTTKSCTATKL